MNRESVISRNKRNAIARKEVISANQRFDYANYLKEFHNVFNIFSQRSPDVEIDILTKITGNQNLNPFRNYGIDIPGIGGLVVREAIHRMQYTSDKVLSLTDDDQLQVYERIQGWSLDNVITIPRSYDDQNKNQRLILALDGRNWLGGMLRRETELPTFGVEGKDHYLESLEDNWDGLKTDSRKIAITNIQNVISSIHSFSDSI